MFIAHVFFSVTPANRTKALDVLLAELPIVRQMKGCISFVPFEDPSNPEKLGILHEWTTQHDFDAYVGSAVFSRVGQTLRPMMIAPPLSKRFDATMVEALA